MKKSNKLLLGGFITVLLILCVLHITLYAKYKNGQYTIYNPENDVPPASMQLFPAIQFVSISDIPNARVQFTDVARIAKREQDWIRYEKKGDTLLITAREGVRQDGHAASFSLPFNTTMSLSNATITFNEGKQAGENNPVIYAQNSRVIFSSMANQFRLGNVRIVASKNSFILFDGKTSVNHLDLQLSGSAIEYAEGEIGQLSIVTDSVSRISLQSKHLLKANIKTPGRE